MKIAVLGGLGMQGRAAIADLGQNDKVTEIVCVDTGDNGHERLRGLVDLGRVRFVSPDGQGPEAFVAALEGADAAIDLLPQPLMHAALTAAIRTRTPIVTTNYAKGLEDLVEPAEKAGTAVMAECGLDPGIDLVLYARAAQQFDMVEEIHSYCGGVPEPKARTNPLSYKVSWNFDMVLASQQRDSVMIADGEPIAVPASIQHDNEFIHQIDVPLYGALEAFPNGDAARYVTMLGLNGVKRSGRYTLRWPGWSNFWHPLKQLGLLSDIPLEGVEPPTSPRRFISRLLAPQMQYADDERDLCFMRNVFVGVKDGRRMTLTTDLVIERNLDSGLFAMSLGVGYPASIVAQMMARGEIAGHGVLNPATHLPAAPFLHELARRGITIEDRLTSA